MLKCKAKAGLSDRESLVKPLTIQEDNYTVAYFNYTHSSLNNEGFLQLTSPSVDILKGVQHYKFFDNKE